METSASIQCPYCGQRFELVIDTSVDSQRFGTDCEVCCRPFEGIVECAPGGILSLQIAEPGGPAGQKTGFLISLCSSPDRAVRVARSAALESENMLSSVQVFPRRNVRRFGIGAGFVPGIPDRDRVPSAHTMPPGLEAPPC